MKGEQGPAGVKGSQGSIGPQGRPISLFTLLEFYQISGAVVKTYYVKAF